MDRRGFLRTTFVGGLASGCASRDERASEPPLAAAELERELEQLDRLLARMDGKLAKTWFRERRAGEIAVAEGPQRAAIRDDGDRVTCTMKSLLTVSTLAALPKANHADPAVVERLRRVAGEADYALFGTLEELRSLDADALARLDRDAREDPRFVAEIAEQVDALASRMGVGSLRRAHLRGLTNHVGWRVEREGMSTLVRDTIEKVDGVLAGYEARLAREGVPAHADPTSPWVERIRSDLAREREPPPEPASGEPPASVEPVAIEPVVIEPVLIEPPVEPASPEPESALPDYATLDSDAVLQTHRAQMQAARQAEYERIRRQRNILLGTGGALFALAGGAMLIGGLLAGGLAVIPGGIVMTAAVILLILGLIRVARARKARP